MVQDRLRFSPKLRVGALGKIRRRLKAFKIGKRWRGAGDAQP
jgi:hypothetical protein